MSRERPLRGTCACGRNRYTVEVPEDSEQTAQVYFENSGQHRRHHAAPLTAFLRVPLTWYHSTTFPFYPDEAHSSIRRMYTTPSTPSSKRQFCGFCGTPLSYWNEDPPTEADFISLTLGSLSSDDLHELEDLGLLPPEAAEDAREEKEQMGSLERPPRQQSQQEDAASGGVPWFETMIHGSRLGALHHKGTDAGRNRQGGVRVEWEIVEWDETGELGSSKRKRPEAEGENLKGDVEMKG